MKRKFFFVFILAFYFYNSYAQSESIEHQGEFGVTFGASHYFGDLNPRGAINKPGAAGGIFYLKQFNNF